MPWSLLLNPKVLGALALVAVLAYAVKWHGDQVETVYQSGYDARVNDEREAAATAADAIAEEEKRENEKALKLQKELRDARRHSAKLAAQIRNASFTCRDVGPSFVELFNEGTRAGY